MQILRKQRKEFELMQLPGVYWSLFETTTYSSITYSCPQYSLLRCFSFTQKQLLRERPFTMPSSQLFVFVSDIVFGSCSSLSDHSDKFSSGSELKNVLRQQTKPFVWAENIWIWILVICIINKVFLTYIWSNHKQNQGLKTVENCVISAVNSREILRFLS